MSSRPTITTSGLIERLQALDPAGERTVFVEAGSVNSMLTGRLARVYVEDGNATWDEDRLRVVLTTEEP